MYGETQPEAFVADVSVLLRGLNRKIAIEVQSGEGRIKSGKLPLTYGMYRQLNELLLMESSTEAISALFFVRDLESHVSKCEYSHDPPPPHGVAGRLSRHILRTHEELSVRGHTTGSTELA